MVGQLRNVEELDSGYAKDDMVECGGSNWVLGA